VATLADASVEIIADLDKFEPDLRRKLTKAIKAAGEDAEKQFQKAGLKAGRAFADAVANSASAAADDARFRQAGEIAGGQFGGGFVRRAGRSFEGFVPDVSGVDDALRTAARSAETELTRAGTNGGRAFSDAVADAAKTSAANIDKIRASIVSLEAAAQRAGDSQVDAAQRAERAEAALAKVKRETSLVTLDGAEKIIAAEQRVAKARRDAGRAADAERAAVVALRDAGVRLAEAGTAGGDAFSQSLRKAVTKSSAKTGSDAGGFFANAFQTAAARSIGTGLVRTFAALGATLLTSVSPLATILGGAAAATVALAGAIGQASGAALAFGGVLGSLGLAAATVKVGFAGVGDAVKAQSKALAEFNAEGKVSESTQKALDAALKNLAPNAAAVVQQLGAMAPAWAAVRQVVQNNLFAGVAESLRQLGSTFLPILQTQLGRAATTLSQFATGFASFLTAPPQAGQINTILTSLNTILANLLAGVKPLTAGLLTFFTASLPFAERLSETIGSLGDRFAAFAQTSVGSGAFEEFLTGAFEAASNLLGLLANLGSIIGSVFGAGASAGNSLLGVLEELTGDLAAFLKTAEGQAALASFFGLIGAAGEALRGIFATLGPAVSGVAAVFTALRPVLTALGAALQPVILAFSELIGSSLTQLAPILATLLTGLTPLITALGQGLVTVLGAVLQAIIPILPVIVQFATTLAANLVPVVNALAPVMVQIAVAFGQFLVAITPVLTALLPLIPPLAQIAVSFATLLLALTPLLTQFAQLAAVTSGEVAAGLAVVVPFIVALAEHMANVINVVARVTSAIVGFVSRAVALFNQLRSGGADAFTALQVTILAVVANLVSRVVAFFTNLVSQTLGVLRGFIASAAAAAGQIASGILSAITRGLSGLAAAFRRPFDAARDAVAGAIDRIVGVVSAGVDRIQGLISRISGAIGRLGSLSLPSINIPGFPGLANGGLVARPTIAAIGEAGPEVVIPLTRPGRRDQLLDHYFNAGPRSRQDNGGAYRVPAPVTRTREVHMPITVQGLSKDETTSVVRGVLDRRLGSHIGINTSGGDL
jgi:phage-related protein